MEGFISNMKLLIAEIKNLGAACMVGSVYPNNFYDESEYELLLMTFQEMKKWKEENRIDALFNFMIVDDGKGHWIEGTYADPSHPNHEGHKRMFDAIDLSVFDKFVTSKPLNQKL